ncbi:MAG TPA: prepilin-type N-terminal cleavage/methylation domain-containing protein [Phycisphaerales bacterium]|nr:prepilin-type N-terminal cleavage/methylation domain-containing protein [Phycisphaerales bacterium]HMP36382.1 prepilin-type N-terminal cleavage/methylation domain-containing protein [Phycisphaerales bacterium]
MARSRRNLGPRRAFTLVEAIVALGILAILAVLMIPSFASLEERRVRLAIDEVEDLLTLYGFRDTTASTSIKLERDLSDGSIGLWSRQIDPDYPDERAAWLPDRFMRPVFLPEDVELIDVRVDGRRYDPSGWSITRVPGEPRSMIELDLVGGDLEVTLVLTPHALSAHRIERRRGVLGNDPGYRIRVDLDGEGRSRETW